MPALRATVRVPGIARIEADHPAAVPIDLWLTLSATCMDVQSGIDEPLVTIERAGTLRRLDVAALEDRLTRGFLDACRIPGRTPPARLVLRVSSQIPLSLGLGASAAATVAGALAANALLRLGLDDSAIARLCGTIDGDAPAVAAVLSSEYVVQIRAECEPAIADRDVHTQAVSVS
jgi:homoserine kinase